MALEHRLLNSVPFNATTYYTIPCAINGSYVTKNATTKVYKVFLVTHISIIR
jgi:hypothetical protein